jgi:hypothetical protein
MSQADSMQFVKSPVFRLLRQVTEDHPIHGQYRSGDERKGVLLSPNGTFLRVEFRS